MGRRPDITGWRAPRGPPRDDLCPPSLCPTALLRPACSVFACWVVRCLLPPPHKANPTAVPRGLEQCWNREGARRFCPVNKGVTERVTVLVWGGPILPVDAHSSAGHAVLAGPVTALSSRRQRTRGKSAPWRDPWGSLEPQLSARPPALPGYGNPSPVPKTRILPHSGYCQNCPRADPAPTGGQAPCFGSCSGQTAGPGQQCPFSGVPELPDWLPHTYSCQEGTQTSASPVPIFAPAQGLQGRGKVWEGRASGRWPFCAPGSGSGRPR